MSCCTLPFLFLQSTSASLLLSLCIFARLSSLPPSHHYSPFLPWLPPSAAKLGAPFRHWALVISREMDRAVVLAAGISAPSSALTCPDLNSPLERAGRTVRDSSTKQKWDCGYRGNLNYLLHGQAALFVYRRPLSINRVSIVNVLLVTVVKMVTTCYMWRLQRTIHLSY